MAINKKTQASCRILGALHQSLTLVILLMKGMPYLSAMPLMLGNDHSPLTIPYLPLKYELQDEESFFLLKNTKQDAQPLNTSLHALTQPILILNSTKEHSGIKVSLGSFSTWQPLPKNPLGFENIFPQKSAGLTTNWNLQAHVLQHEVFSSNPKLQVVFYISGRDWNKKEQADDLPCVKLQALSKVQELKTSCRLAGELGMCLVELAIPSTWFEQTASNSNSKLPKDGAVTSGLIELYSEIFPPDEEGKCGSGMSKTVHDFRTQNEADTRRLKQLLRPIGRVIVHAPSRKPPEQQEARLDNNVVIYLPTNPAKLDDILSIPVCLLHNSTIDHLTIRVKCKRGISFIGVLPSETNVFDINTEINNGEKFSTATLQITLKSGATRDGDNSGSLEMARIEMVVESFSLAPAFRRLLWHLEYPQGGPAPSLDRINTEIVVKQSDAQALIPLAMKPELVNTAVLTGRPVIVPLRVVTMGTDGHLSDVSQHAHCQSEDEDIIKVSENCGWAFVNGKESRGSARARLIITNEHLRVSLDMTVWMPQLPLQIQLSDSHLSVIKGWRVPIFHEKSTEESSDEEDEPKGRGCMLQSQHALVSIWTMFCTSSDEPADGRGPHESPMLSPEWLVDVTELVLDYMVVEDTRTAQLVGGKVVVGLVPGMTAIQVLSPVSDLILGERAVTVSKEKVSISRLHVTLVSGLSLTLRPSPSESNVVISTTTAQHTLQVLKQEATLVLWLQFSDGTVTPMDAYNPRDYVLSVSSLDESALSVRFSSADGWPSILAEGEGNEPGGLLKVELLVCNGCQKSKRRGSLATVNVNVSVSFGNAFMGTTPNVQWDQRHLHNGSLRGHIYTEREEVGVKRGGTTSGPQPGEWRNHGVGDQGESLQEVLQKRGSSDSPPVDPKFPQKGTGVRSAGDQAQRPSGLSDLQIGMYTLLSVFCLAILVFLINCTAFVIRYKRKQLVPQAQDEIGTHSHDWIQLRNVGDERGSQGGFASTSKQSGEAAADRKMACNHISRSHPKNELVITLQGIDDAIREGSPKSKASDSSVHPLSLQKKRVTFSAFTTVHSPDKMAEISQTIPVGKEQDIEWLCLDPGLRDSEEPHTDIHRIKESG
ncbi:transmembrane protein 132E-like [Lethenteron reissneri]|uniref:transmembrane protein 132E-like n=1 Tax=Lethenteron reissneri TaxID=7753 RepID=UPI002AB6FB82|nr:transmembrane protein 132E-like [Lethenteron reissneri]